MKKLIISGMIMSLLVCSSAVSAFAACSSTTCCPNGAIWVKQKFPNRTVEFFREDGEPKVKVYDADNKSYTIYNCVSMEGGKCHVCQ